VVLMGKNTMMKRSIKEHSKRTKNTEWLVRSDGSARNPVCKPLAPRAAPAHASPPAFHRPWPSCWSATSASSSPRCAADAARALHDLALTLRVRLLPD
jgi:hypothetical protein